MIKVFSRRAGLALVCATGIFASFLWSPSRQLDAGGGSVWTDTDGDLLPDDVEWMLMFDPCSVDSDDDGVDDFLAAVTYQYPQPLDDVSLLNGGEPTGLDHESRVVLSIRPDANGDNAVWMHILFRFVGQEIPPITLFHTWINQNGISIPIDGIIGAGPVEFQLSPPGPEGTYFRYSARIASQNDFVAAGDLTIGATMIVDGREISTGVFCSNFHNHLTVFAPLSPSAGVTIPLDPSVAQDPFWADDRVCWMSLSVIATTSEGSLCEVTNAFCRYAGDLRCPPTCPDSISSIIFAPDGMATLTGGG